MYFHFATLRHVCIFVYDPVRTPRLEFTSNESKTRNIKYIKKYILWKILIIKTKEYIFLFTYLITCLRYFKLTGSSSATVTYTTTTNMASESGRGQNCHVTTGTCFSSLQILIDWWVEMILWWLNLLVDINQIIK